MEIWLEKWIPNLVMEAKGQRGEEVEGSKNGLWKQVTYIFPVVFVDSFSPGDKEANLCKFDIWPMAHDGSMGPGTGIFF